MDEKISDQDLFEYLSEQIENYPHFKDMLPNDYPSAAKYNISRDKLEKYSSERASKTWTHLNLPFCLYMLCYPEEKPKQLANSVLSTFNKYCELFKDLPGSKGVLDPLYKSAWDMGDACFWSVYGECILALFLYDNQADEFPVQGFERSIGTSNNKCDIKTTFRETPLNIDIEIKHINKEYPDDPEIFRSWVVNNANTKMKSKFKDLPEGEFGVIAQLYMLNGKNISLFYKYKEQLMPVFFEGRTNQFTHIYWIVGGRFVNGDDIGTFGVHLVDNQTVAELISD